MEKYFKRVVLLLLIGVLAFGVYGCSSSSDDGTDTAADPTVETPAEETTAAVKVPSWVLSDYVWWEVIDFIDNGDLTITHDGDVETHTNIEIVDNTTVIYFNEEKPLIPETIPYTYIAYYPKAEDVRPYGKLSNGGRTTDLGISFGDDANSDIYLNFGLLPNEELEAFKSYVSATSTQIRLGIKDDTPAVYTQFNDILAYASDPSSKLSVVVDNKATLSVSKPVVLSQLLISTGGTLDLSGAASLEGLIGGKLEIDSPSGEVKANLIFPTGTTEEQVSAFLASAGTVTTAEVNVSYK